MAAKPGILVQATPAAGVVTSLYTVPEMTRVIVSRITAFNNSGSDSTETVSVAVEGAAAADSQNTWREIVSGGDWDQVGVMTLGPGDVIRAHSTVGDTAYTVYGVELDGWLEGQT